MRVGSRWTRFARSSSMEDFQDRRTGCMFHLRNGGDASASVCAERVLCLLVQVLSADLSPLSRQRIAETSPVLDCGITRDDG